MYHLCSAKVIMILRILKKIYEIKYMNAIKITFRRCAIREI
jgi:hypothetical protein